MPYLTAAFAAYLLGSVPWGYLAGRVNGRDLRTEGSGNTGATNAVRVLGRKWGGAVFALDFLKGWAAVMAGFAIAKWGYGGTEDVVVRSGVVSAVFVVLGHNFPVWLGFRGGKGIATSGGLMVALFPPMVFASGLAVWVVLFFGTRYVSVASLGAALALPASAGVLWSLGQCDPLRFGVAAALCVLAVWRHKANIGRLVAGTEKRFERKTRVAS